MCCTTLWVYALTSSHTKELTQSANFKVERPGHAAQRLGGIESVQCCKILCDVKVGISLLHHEALGRSNLRLACRHRCMASQHNRTRNCNCNYQLHHLVSGFLMSNRVVFVGWQHRGDVEWSANKITSLHSLAKLP